jgi:tripartite-type tricarboxylate transporter receptor subunit TctC
MGIGLLLASGAMLPALAQAQDFYKGKTLTIVVGFTPGGGFDINARLLARHIGRHIPGNPTVVVQNLPGAAGLNSVRYLDAPRPRTAPSSTPSTSAISATPS